MELINHSFIQKEITLAQCVVYADQLLEFTKMKPDKLKISDFSDVLAMFLSYCYKKLIFMIAVQMMKIHNQNIELLVIAANGIDVVEKQDTAIHNQLMILWICKEMNQFNQPHYICMIQDVDHAPWIYKVTGQKFQNKFKVKTEHY